MKLLGLAKAARGIGDSAGAVAGAGQDGGGGGGVRSCSAGAGGGTGEVGLRRVAGQRQVRVMSAVAGAARADEIGGRQAGEMVTCMGVSKESLMNELYESRRLCQLHGWRLRDAWLRVGM